LLSVVLNLGFQVRDAPIAGVQLRAMRGDFRYEKVHLFASIGERAVANPGRHIPFPFRSYKGMESTKNETEFEPHPVAPQPVLEGPLAALLEWQALAEGAYSANTLRAQKADGAIFQAFYELRGEPYLPADPKTTRDGRRLINRSINHTSRSVKFACNGCVPVSPL
jgi:hypothetical protein